jgi:hypothetical protein
VIDLDDKIGGWLVVVCMTVAGVYGMLAMTGLTGTMVCKRLGGTVSESDEAEQCQEVCAGEEGVKGSNGDDRGVIECNRV